MATAPTYYIGSGGRAYSSFQAAEQSFRPSTPTPSTSSSAPAPGQSTENYTNKPITTTTTPAPSTSTPAKPVAPTQPTFQIKDGKVVYYGTNIPAPKATSETSGIIGIKTYNTITGRINEEQLMQVQQPPRTSGLVYTMAGKQVTVPPNVTSEVLIPYLKARATPEDLGFVKAYEQKTQILKALSGGVDPGSYYDWTTNVAQIPQQIPKGSATTITKDLPVPITPQPPIPKEKGYLVPTISAYNPIEAAKFGATKIPLSTNLFERTSTDYFLEQYLAEQGKLKPANQFEAALLGGQIVVGSLGIVAQGVKPQVASERGVVPIDRGISSYVPLAALYAGTSFAKGAVEGGQGFLEFGAGFGRAVSSPSKFFGEEVPGTTFPMIQESVNPLTYVKGTIEDPIGFISETAGQMVAFKGIEIGFAKAIKTGAKLTDIFIPKEKFSSFAPKKVVEFYQRGELKALTFQDVGASNVKQLIEIPKQSPAKLYVEKVLGVNLPPTDGVVARVMLTRTKNVFERITQKTDVQLAQGFSKYEIGSSFSASTAPTGFPLKVFTGGDTAYKFSLFPRLPLIFEPNIVLVKSGIGKVSGTFDLISKMGKGKASVELLKQYGYDLSKSTELYAQNLAKTSKGGRVLQVRQIKGLEGKVLELELEKIKVNPKLSAKKVYPTVSEYLGAQTEAEFTFVGNPILRKVGLEGKAQKLAGKTAITEFPLGGKSTKRVAIEVYENIGEQDFLSKKIKKAIDKERQALREYEAYAEKGYYPKEVRYISPIEGRYLLTPKINYSEIQRAVRDTKKYYSKYSFSQQEPYLNYYNQSYIKQPKQLIDYSKNITQEIENYKTTTYKNYQQIETQQIIQSYPKKYSPPTYTTIRYPTTEPPTSITPTPSSKKEYSKIKEKRKFGRGFVAFVKRKGKFRQVNKFALPKGLAIESGKKVALQTTAQTFTIKEMGQTELEDVGRADLSQFRPPAQRTKLKGEPLFVQRNPITTTSEKAELKQARKTKARWQKWGF